MSFFGNSSLERRLFNAISSGSLQRVELLIEQGARVNFISAHGETPMDRAVYRGNIPILEALIQNGAKINAQNLAGRTPLISAVIFSSRKKDVIDLLLESGANMDIQDKGGKTALLHAVDQNKTDVAELLIKHGADFTLQDTCGKTVVSICQQKKHYKLLELIEKAKSGRFRRCPNLNTWDIFDSNSVANIRRQGKLKITKVFNFKAHDITTVTENEDTKQENINIIKFHRDNDSSIKKAFKHYKEQGGA